MKAIKKRSKKKVYDDLRKLPDLKARLDAFIKLFTEQAFQNKEVSEEAYKAIVDYTQISFVFLKAFPELLEGENRKRTRALLTHMSIAKAINFLYSGVVKLTVEQMLVEKKIFTRNKKNELIATQAFKSGKVFFNWDKAFTDLKKDNLKLLISVFENNDAVLSQILIEFSDFKDADGNPYYTEFMFLEGYLYKNSYGELLDNIDNIEFLFQEKIARDFVDNTSYQFYEKFKESKKITFLTDIYKTKDVDKIKDDFYNELMEYFKVNRVRITLMKNEVLDEILERMSNKLNKNWSKKNVKKNKK